MAFEALDIRKHHLERLGFSVSCDRIPEASEGLLAPGEPGSPLRFGYHDFSVDGTDYRLVVVSASEAEGLPFNTFHLDVLTLSAAPGEASPAGRSLTASQAEAVADAVLASSAPDTSLLRARFLFPDHMFEAVAFADSGAHRWLDADWNRDQERRLELSGLRYCSYDGMNDVRIDASEGDIRIDVQLVWRRVASLAEVGDEVGDVAAVARTFVRGWGEPLED